MRTGRLSSAIVALLFLSPAVASAAIGTVPTSGLVGHWSFDEGSGTAAADSSGNGNNASLINSPTWVTGIAGSAVNFATSSTNQVTFPAGLQNTGFPTNGTLSFWIKGDFSVQTSGSIFDNASSRNHVFVRTNGSGNLQIALEDASGNYLNQKAQTITGVTGTTQLSVPANTWTHVALVWDTTNEMAYVYENGSLAESFFWGAYSQTWTPSAQVFKLSNSSTPFAGSVDDVALYSRPLSAAEISAIYDGTAAPAADVTAPSAPTSLAGNGFGPTKITLGWSPSTDNVGIGGYIIYRDGVPVGYASSTSLAYTDTGLATSTSHTYQVYAFDTSGNRSAASNSITVSTDASQLLLTTGFEEESTLDTADIGGWTQYGPNDAAIAVTTDEARSGAHAVKFDFNFSDWNSTDTNFHQRAQISQTSPITFTLGQTYWTSVSTFIPTSWQDDYATNDELIWQFHGSTSGPSYGSSPPFALYIDGDTENLNVRGATSTVYAVGTAPFATTIASMPLDPDKGKWVDWVIETTFNYSGGVIRVWKDGVEVADYTGANVYHQSGQTNDTGPWFNVGPYKWDWGNLATQVTNRTMYADDINIADNTESCTGISPIGAAPCSANPSLYTVTDNGPTITGMSVASNGASTTVASVGNVVTLSFTSDQNAELAPAITIAGRTASMVAGAGNTWTASTTMQASDTEGVIPFVATIDNSTGSGTTTVRGVISGTNVDFDKTPPVITLKGSASDSISAGQTYNDPGASATDAHDGTVPVVVSGTVGGVPGTYMLTYTATDAAGNRALLTRTVTVNPAGNGPVASGSWTPPTQIVPEAAPATTSTASSSYPETQSSNSASLIETLKAQVLALLAKIAELTGKPLIAPSFGSWQPASFTRDLQLNDHGADVLALQQYLNTSGFTVARSGPGSSGKETNFFGLATYHALADFQLAHGLSGTGYFGPLTRRLIKDTSFTEEPAHHTPVTGQMATSSIQ